MAITGIYRGLEYESLRRDEGPFHCGEDILRNGEAWFSAAKA